MLKDICFSLCIMRLKSLCFTTLLYVSSIYDTTRLFINYQRAFFLSHIKMNGYVLVKSNEYQTFLAYVQN